MSRRATGRRTGVSRREFLRSTAGAATVLLALNETGCSGGNYPLPKEAAHEPEAADTVLKGDEFIFDVQTHHVDLRRNWAADARPNMSNYLSTIPQSRCGANPPLACFDQDHYLKRCSSTATRTWPS